MSLTERIVRGWLRKHLQSGGNHKLVVRVLVEEARYNWWDDNIPTTRAYLHELIDEQLGYKAQ